MIMCLSPVTILNPNKYISLKYRDRYLLQVPCGKCAECQSANSNAWLYRSYVEANDCLSSNHYLLFDTLTYKDKYLPHISDFVRTDVDYPCFNHRHVTLFFKRLRRKVEKLGYGSQSFRFFLSSEYGTDSRYSHRPHYHVLFYVYADIEPLILSSLIAECWSYGRTDGIPYQTTSYVKSHNIIRSRKPADLLHISNYVTKYVQKSCLFQHEIDRRISEVIGRIADDIDFVNDYETDWINSSDCRELRVQLKRNCNQFHRQSLHFGESALKDFDLIELFKTGAILMPHYKGVKIPIPLPMYYKRKLFYDLCEIDGTKVWQLNDLGVDFNKARHDKLVVDLADRFQCVGLRCHLNYDWLSLAKYVYDIRGRIKADLSESRISERLDSVSLYNYLTPSDRKFIGIGITPVFVGNTKLGYSVSKIPSHYTPMQFISSYVMLDDEKEKQLSDIYYHLRDVQDGKQLAYELKQRLCNLYKMCV